MRKQLIVELDEQDLTVLLPTFIRANVDFSVKSLGDPGVSALVEPPRASRELPAPSRPARTYNGRAVHGRTGQTARDALRAMAQRAGPAGFRVGVDLKALGERTGFSVKTLNNHAMALVRLGELTHTGHGTYRTVAKPALEAAE